MLHPDQFRAQQDKEYENYLHRWDIARSLAYEPAEVREANIEYVDLSVTELLTVYSRALTRPNLTGHAITVWVHTQGGRASAVAVFCVQLGNREYVVTSLLPGGRWLRNHPRTAVDPQLVALADRSDSLSAKDATSFSYAVRAGNTDSETQEKVREFLVALEQHIKQGD